MTLLAPQIGWLCISRRLDPVDEFAAAGLAFARGTDSVTRPQMNTEQARCLDSLNAPGLKDATVLSDLSCRMADRALERSSYASEFIYRLLESCAKPAFTIWPDTDVEPIAWVLTLGVSFDEVLAAVAREYPEIGPR